MAYKKKAAQKEQAAPINTKNRYRVVVREFRGQVNKSKYSGNEGDILEMEPWEAAILSAYVREIKE